MLQVAQDTKMDRPSEDLLSPTRDYCPKRRSDLSVRVVEGETVVLDRQGGLIHQFNRTASEVWDRCDGSHTVLQMAEQLVEAYDVDLATAVADVIAIVRQLHTLTLLQSSDG